MHAIHSQIAQWASKLAYWEQSALRWILEGRALNESDYQQLLIYLLEDAGLADTTLDRPQLVFDSSATNETIEGTQTILLAISDLDNINALIPGQRLEFGKQLTAIYGANGSGKSGYARVLGSAAYTRGDHDVLPNVMASYDVNRTQRAIVTVTDGTQERPVEYRIGENCPELAGFYMFDSTAVRVHMSAENLISFSPAGLKTLPHLAEVTDRVRELLAEEIESRSIQMDFVRFFEGESSVKDVISTLDAETDLEQVRSWAAITPAERRRIAVLSREIAQLRSRNVPFAVTNLNRTVSDLEELLGKLEMADNALNDERLQALATALDQASKWQMAADQIDTSDFAIDGVSYVGTNAWSDFIRAAQNLAQTVHEKDDSYPNAGDRCLLCQQPLDTEAIALIRRLWKFLDNEIQISLARANQVLEAQRQVLSAVDMEFFQPQEVWYRYLLDRDEGLVSNIADFLETSRTYRSRALSASQRFELPIGATKPSAGTDKIRAIIKGLLDQIDELQASDPTLAIQHLEEEQRLLQHRVVLQQHLDMVLRYAENLKWAKKAKKIGGSTRHITQKHNELFDELVTRRYIQLFEQTLTALGRPLQVEVRMKGRKGQAIKQVIVKVDASTPTRSAIPEKILSEGEKRAVALADFLTEVALDSSSRGIILDDPVTSLDLEWRQIIASILASEAQRQQVIVFTHDLPFLYFLLNAATNADVEARTHWIKRGDLDDVPGYVFLDNSPALEKEYRSSNHARKCYARAKSSPPQEQERILREGFAALRTSYEAFIIFELLNEVVLRFGERVSFGRLQGIVWDQSIVQDVIGSCERLSRCMEGHLHSDLFSPVKPTPAMLLDECEHFDAMKNQLKSLRKQGS